MHPEPLADRRHRAAEERRVCFEPAEDGMAWLSLHLEAERGVAIMARLDALADARPATDGRPIDAAPDSRTRTQLTLDVAADLLLGDAPGVLGRSRASRASGASPLGVVIPKVYVTVPVLTLLGHSEQPAELDGYGPIDADTARRLAAHAPSFRRILTHPETGALPLLRPQDVPGAGRPRRATSGSAMAVAASPAAPAAPPRSDIDHTTDWAVGGATRHDNLAHLCRKHHRLKHKTGWRMSAAARRRHPLDLTGRPRAPLHASPSVSIAAWCRR